MTPIKGDLCLLYLNEYGATAGAKIIGCTTGDSITFNTEVVEVTGLSSDFVELLPTYQSGTISSDMVVLETEGGDSQFASRQLVEWQKTKQKLQFQLYYGVHSIAGAAYITSLSINAPAQDFASVQLALNISGEWGITY